MTKDVYRVEIVRLESRQRAEYLINHLVHAVS